MCIKTDYLIECMACGYPYSEAKYPDRDNIDNPLPCDSTEEEIIEYLKSLQVKCKFCGKYVDANTAHLHCGEYIGDECCWDERLKTTE